MSWLEKLSSLHGKSIVQQTSEEEDFAIEFDYDKQLQIDVQQSVVTLQDESSSIDDQLHALRLLHGFVAQCDEFAEKSKSTGDASLTVDQKPSVYRIDEFNRRRINQLIVDSVLRIILDERQKVNPLRRQLIRVELYLLLGKLLQSSSLFGSELTRSTVAKMNEVMQQSTHKPTPPTTTHGRPRSPTRSLATSADDASVEARESGSPSSQRLRSSSSTAVLHSSHHKLNSSPLHRTQRAPIDGRGTGTSSNHNHDNSIASWKKFLKKPMMKRGAKVTFRETDGSVPSTADNLNFESTTERVLDSSSRQSSRRDTRSVSSAGGSQSQSSTLLGDIVSADKRKLELDPRLKPRPSILFDDKLEVDNFVPGADPLNFFEQDRKLGYQKPRMWFPTPQLQVANRLLSSGAHGGANEVVEEYLRMKAVASYVGDMVIPSSVMNSLSSSQSPYEAILSTTRSALVRYKNKFEHTAQRNLIDPIRYAQALSEAMHMWTPILAAHRAETSSRKKRSYNLFFRENAHTSSGNRNRDKANQGLMSLSDDANEMDDKDEGAFLTESSNTLTNAEVDMSQRKKRRTFLEESVPLEVEEYGSLPKRPQTRLDQYERFSSQFTKEQEQVSSEIDEIKKSIDAIISSNKNKIFAPKYTLVLEGDQAKSRRLLNKLTRSFVHHKRHNCLALAFGLWSILIVEQRSLAKRPHYARIASCHLMLNWLIKASQRNFKNWFRKWKLITAHCIFLERRQAVLIIQRQFRRRESKKLMLRMHEAGKYLGMLSDIRLGPQRRNVRFAFPSIIRTERRMYWLAATIIQSIFRCWFSSKDYLKRKRQLILLQSICRMWPKRCYFLRLKATTIKCQAWGRRTVQRKKFVRMRKAAIVIQKYSRRFLMHLWKLRTLYMLWAEKELRMCATIRIQCRWRIVLAKRVRKRKKFRILLREYSALVIQRNWYRHKRAFHTFFLMCALRERERQDIAYEVLATKMGRFQSARRIQRFYHLRYQHRILDNAVRVQSWFRGRMAHFLVIYLRRIRWACRKLHHWAKVRVKRWHKMARRIQRFWWRLRSRRLLRHLWHRVEMNEQRFLQARAERRYAAAARIQAHVKGIWDRRFTKHTRAALTIQRNWRFFNGIRKWKNMKRENVMSTVRRFVKKILDRAVQKQTTVLVQRHERLIVKAQALFRGYRVRVVMFHAREYAALLGKSVLCIQRAWRRMKATFHALEEIHAKRRMNMNPFKACRSMHDMLWVLKRETKFSFQDIRVGMRINTFLYRLGLVELQDVFVTKDCQLVSELMLIVRTVEKCTEMYELSQKKKRLQKLKQSNNNNSNNSGASGKLSERTKGPPLASFKAIVDLLSIPLYPKQQQHIEMLQQLLPYPEYCSPLQCYESIRKKFLKKYGKHFQSRASNVARDIMERSWKHYNNYRSIGNVLTSGLVDRAFANAQESHHFINVLDEMIENSRTARQVSDEWKWDAERLQYMANISQLAVDKSLLLLPKLPLVKESDVNSPSSVRAPVDGSPSVADNDSVGSSVLAMGQNNSNNMIALTVWQLREQLEKAANRITAYRRKCNYLSKTLKATDRKGSVATKGASNNNNRAVSPNLPTGGNSSTANAEEELDIPVSSIVSAEEMQVSWASAPQLTLDLFYYGGAADLDIELNISTAKLYLFLLERMGSLSNAVLSLQNAFNNICVRRAFLKERRRQFLEAQTVAYIQEQRQDRVRVVWNKLRKKETIQKKLSLILEAVQQRREWIESMLEYLPRYHITVDYDEMGYSYYIDESGNSSYEMPIYSYTQYLAILKMQAIARRHIEQQRIRDWQRAEEERLALEKAEEKLLEERKKALKAVDVHIDIVDRTEEFAQSKHMVSAAAVTDMNLKGGATSVKAGTALGMPKDSKKSKKADYLQHLEIELDEMLPWKYRFDSGVMEVSNGTWCLLFTATGKESIFGLRTGTLESVVVFHVRTTEQLCDVRSVKGKITKGVSFRRLRHMNFEVNCPVECRYKYQKRFYRAKIISIDDYEKPRRGHDDVITPASLITKGTKSNPMSLTTFGVAYEDGEQEFHMERDALRPSQSYLMQWQIEREQHLQRLRVIRRRQLHFDRIVRQRKQFQQRLRQAADATQSQIASLTVEIPPSGTSGKGVTPSKASKSEKRVSSKRTSPMAASSPGPQSSSTPTNATASAEALEHAEESLSMAVDSDFPDSEVHASDSMASKSRRLVPSNSLLNTHELEPVAEVTNARDGEEEQDYPDDSLKQSSLRLNLSVADGRVTVKVSIKVCRAPLEFDWVMIDGTLRSSLNAAATAENLDEEINPLEWDAYEYRRLTRRRERLLAERQNAIARREQQQKIFEGDEISSKLLLIANSNFDYDDQQPETSDDFVGNLDGQSLSKIIFYNTATEEQVGIAQIPLYSIPQIFYLLKIQAKWRLCRAMKHLRRRIRSLPLLSTISQTIREAAAIGFVGYKLEGLSTYQLIIRAGYYELADIIRDHFIALQKPLSSLSFEDVVDKSKEDYETLGVIQTSHVRDLKELQTWWKKTLPYERESKLMLFNSYSSPDDPRSIQDCIQAGVDVMFRKFVKYIKASQSKTKQALANLALQSNFPHSHQQVETYLKRYADKPELARDSVIDILNKMTTSTYVEEERIYKLLMHVACKLSAALAQLHVPQVLQRVRDAIRRAEKMHQQSALVPLLPVENNIKAPPQRLLCSGPEGKAAWILRLDVFQYLSELLQATVKIQRRMKVFLQHRRWKSFLTERLRAIDCIQRVGRRYLAYNQAKYLRAQRDSPWEQLWDNRHNVLYYYNVETGESQYEEPAVILHSAPHDVPESDELTQEGTNVVVLAAPYRPLIRNLVSAALMQAWPHLEDTDERRKSLQRGIPQMSSKLLEALPQQLLCVKCETRRCVRFCLDCDYEAISAERRAQQEHSNAYAINNSSNASRASMSTATQRQTVSSHRPTPYCLTCYSKAHPEDDDAHRRHRFQVAGAMVAVAPKDEDMLLLENGSQEHTGDWEGFLHCSQCNALATRKCLGPFTNELIDEWIALLKRTPVNDWVRVLREEKVAGERKLMLLIESVLREGGVTVVNVEPSNAADDRELSKERDNERQLAVQFSLTGAPTAGSSTNSTGATVSTAVLLQSVRAVLEKSRAECDECYCTSCYQSMHSGGRRALHFWTSFAAGCQVCGVCNASPAQWKCVDCENAEYCDACFAVFHNMGRKKRHARQVLKEVSIVDHQSEDDATTSLGSMYCDICKRRLGQFCPYCSHPAADDDDSQTNASYGENVVCCDECLEYKHKSVCKSLRAAFSPARTQGISATQQSSSSPSRQAQRESFVTRRRAQLEDVGIELPPEDVYATKKSTAFKKSEKPMSDEPLSSEDCLCVVCNDVADKRCVQCGDLYCSRIRPNAPGCFEQFHEKGNRITHKTEPVRLKRATAIPKSVSLSKTVAIGSMSSNTTPSALMSSTMDSKQLHQRLSRPSGR